MTPTQASLFASLVPTGVAVHEIFRPPDHPAATLWWAALPEEERLQALQAVSARRADLAAGRRLAHAALASFGADVPVIGRGIRGEPLWPAGTIGSITHCEGYAAAAAAATTACCAIGIDVEPALSLPAGVLDAIASNSERGHIAALELHDAWTPLGPPSFLYQRGLLQSLVSAGEIVAGLPRRYGASGSIERDVRRRDRTPCSAVDPPGTARRTLGCTRRIHRNRAHDRYDRRFLLGWAQPT